jgi:hypothetical protein
MAPRISLDACFNLTKPMEIIAGKRACDNLLAFICKLPFFQTLVERHYTKHCREAP